MRNFTAGTRMRGGSGGHAKKEGESGSETLG